MLRVEGVFGLYNILLHVVLVVIAPFCPLVLLAKRRLFQGFSERLGRYPTQTKAALAKQQPIWVHAASVGEVKSARPLIEEIRAAFPDNKVLLSTMTATGREIAQGADVRPDAVVYFPLDLPWVVASTLHQLNPSLVILVETEIWPNFIHALHRRGIPVIMVSGRLSVRSERRYQRFAGVFVRVLGEVSTFGMQDRESAERLLGLGVQPSKVFITGSLKQVESTPAKAPPALEAVTGHPARLVVVIGSTHRGEEAMFVESFTALRAEFPNMLLVIAPRHPERFAEVETLLQRGGLRYRKRSEGGAVDLDGYDVLLVDTIGELSWIYGWANVVFVGGTLVDVGGHNLIEPARWGKPILLGPYTGNVAEVAKALIEGGGAVQIRTIGELVDELSHLLANQEDAREMGCRAQAVAKAGGNVLSQTMALVRRFSPTRILASRVHSG